MNRSALDLHHDSIVLDMTCPLMNDPTRWSWWREGGVTVAAPTVAADHNVAETMQRVSRWLKHLSTHQESLVQVTTVADIERAHADGRLGVAFHFQNTLPLERDAGMVEAYAKLGLVVMQLAYNTKNHVGNGCEELSDDGLSRFGREVIREMNRHGVVVDGAHTGRRTLLDAVDRSERPVVVSHANARAVCDNARNLDDDVIRTIAEQGGLIGIVGFPSFVRRGVQKPTLDDLIDHVDHVCQLVGHARASALGIDYYDGMAGVATPEAAAARYQDALDRGAWNPDNYDPPPHHYPDGLEDPRGFPNLTARLLDRGHVEDDVRAILGGNWLRVLEQHGR
jgi:membrane dipeptidase